MLDVVRTILLESSTSSRFWVEAFSTAVHLINLLPSPKLHNNSPYFRLYNKQPSYGHLCPFGCICFVHLPSHERNKLFAQSARCAFLGYATNQKGYLCYDPDINHIRISRNVVFFENQYFFQHQFDSGSQQTISILLDFSNSPNVTRFKPGVVYVRWKNQETDAIGPLPLDPNLGTDPDPPVL